MHESSGVAGDGREAETDFMGVIFVRLVCFVRTSSDSTDSHFPSLQDNT